MTLKSNGWIVQLSKEIYKNPWIRVREDIVVRPDGKKGIYGVVEIPLAVGVVAINEDRDIYLVRQWRYTRDATTLEIPIGAVDEGESVIEAARRELKEETGLTATRWIKLGTVDSNTSITTARAQIYLAEDLTQGEKGLEQTENDLEVVKLSFAKALDFVLNDKITETITVAAIFKAEHRLFNLLRQVSA